MNWLVTCQSGYSGAMSFTFYSGHPGLDLAGTVGYRDDPARFDRLDGPDAVRRWLLAAGILDEVPPVDAAEFAATVALREVIHRLARARAHNLPADAGDRAALNLAAERAPVQVRLLDDGRLTRTGDLTAARATLARATVELLGGPGADQLKECVGERCGRLFLDSSRRGTRRWCDMSECGNRAKAAAYRDRHTPA
jgi:predicted RNA-binding Zn ribbon-like protein